MADLVVGNDAANALQGSAGDDLIYGFDPNGPQGAVNAIAATSVVSGLAGALYAVAPPDDPTRLFIVQKGGDIRILDLATGTLLATPFLDVTAEISTAGEQGLLGLAFHPDFASNGTFFIHLTNPAGDAEIRRYQVSASNPNIADGTSSTLVLGVDLPSNASNHRGGWIGFGPDGYLYAAIGDGGSTPGSSQTIDELKGNILRLDVDADAFPGDATRNYAIPAGNPYVGVTGADEIWAIGLRNPWRASFDRGLGDFFIGDVGGGTWEEINLGQVGANYGWPVFEGPDMISPGPVTGGTATAPIHVYNHNSASRSVTGGYVYRGSSEGLQGHYFFADFATAQIWTLHFNGSAWIATERTAQVTPNTGAIDSPASFGEDAVGNLYIVDFNGEVFRLTPNVASADQGDEIDGLGGNDMLFGGSGADTLLGGQGDDALHGGPGGDVLVGGLGDDFLEGGDGADIAVFSGEQSAYVIVALANGFRIVGPDGTDTVTGVEVLAFATVSGTDGADNLSGSPVGDTLLGNGGDDLLSGLSGDDVVLGGSGNDGIFGGAGNDTLSGGSGNDGIVGGAGRDLIGGDDGNDAIDGGDDSDVVFGGLGNDTIGGGSGDDVILGEAGDDVVFGEDGSDHANGGAGADIALGGAGNDTLGGGADGDILVGGDGDDLLFGEDGIDNANGEAGNDGVVGGAGNDLLGGGVGNDIVVGDDGDDVLFGEVGDDAMNGGFGNDTVLGGDGDDVIGGGAGDDIMLGGFGNDIVFGENGIDLIDGGAGNDVLIGGGNDDVFVFSPGDGADTVVDFFAGAPEDKIWFAGTDLHSFADVQSRATTVAGNTVITYNGFFTVTLNGASAGQLTPGDFIFS